MRKDDAQPLTLGFERAGDAGETDQWNNIVISLSLLNWRGRGQVPWLTRFESSAMHLLVIILPRISNHS